MYPQYQTKKTKHCCWLCSIDATPDPPRRDLFERTPHHSDHTLSALVPLRGAERGKRKWRDFVLCRVVLLGDFYIMNFVFLRTSCCLHGLELMCLMIRDMCPPFNLMMLRKHFLLRPMHVQIFPLVDRGLSFVLVIWIAVLADVDMERFLPTCLVLMVLVLEMQTVLISSNLPLLMSSKFSTRHSSPN